MSNFITHSFRGIDIRVWQNGSADPADRLKSAKRLACELPHGGDFGNGDYTGTVRKIEAPTHPGGEILVWLETDGHATFDIPDGYVVTEVGIHGDSDATTVTVRPVGE